MQENRNSIILIGVFLAFILWLCYANYTGWCIYNTDKVIQDNESTSSGRVRTGNGFHHK